MLYSFYKKALDKVSNLFMYVWSFSLKINGQLINILPQFFFNSTKFNLFYFSPFLNKKYMVKLPKIKFTSFLFLIMKEILKLNKFQFVCYVFF